MSQAAPKPRRRFQFSLRSVLIVTLVVGLWLGYEVRQAGMAKRHRKAVEGLGGRVTTERCGWSLLRFVLPEFGWQVVVVEIPGQVVSDAIEPLVAMPYLRRVRVGYDGTCDLHPDWDRLNRALPGKPIALPREYGYPWEEKPKSTDEQILQRYLNKMEQGPAGVQGLLRDLKNGGTPSQRTSYHVICLADGTPVELLIGNNWTFAPGADSAFSVLLVEDRAVDAAMFETSTRRGRVFAALAKSDRDDTPDVGFVEVPRQAVGVPPPGPGGPVGAMRGYLGLCQIEHGGFKSLLPEEKPAAASDP